MGEIKIINPGLLTSIQDGGRYGYQQFGVPVSGVMDSFSHRSANILVGNDEYEGVLEILMIGPQMEFIAEEVIAITGGDLSPSINGVPIPMWESIHIKKGDRLGFLGMKSGCRSYLAIRGGIEVDAVMGSKSTYIKGKIGGLQGRNLKSGDVLMIGRPKDGMNHFIGTKMPSKYIPDYTQSLEVRVILGPQDDCFTDKGLETFLSTPYGVANECDRMGYRLEGEIIEHMEGGDIISDGISFGAIQVPTHGKPIIMMADRQTIGGYTKIGNVISVDLSKIAQAKLKDTISFKKVTIYEAQRLLKEMEQNMDNIKRECVRKEIITAKTFRLKINGKAYDVHLEELK